MARPSWKSARALLLAAAATPAFAQGPRFIIDNLGVLEGDPYNGIQNGGGGFGQAISANGQHIAGVINRGPVGLFEKTVVRYVNGFAVDLVPDIEDPGNNCRIMGILDDGTVLASFAAFNPDLGVGFYYPHVVRPDGTYTRHFVAPVPEAPNAAVSTMNAQGRFAGASVDWNPDLGRGVSTTIRWSVDGASAEILPTLGGSSFVAAMNASGDIAGGSMIGQLMYPFVIRGGTIENLSLGYTTHLTGMAVSINDAGDVVGNTIENAFRIPVRWKAGGERTILPLFPGVERGAASDINNHGHIVGDNDGWIGTLWYNDAPIELNRIVIDAAAEGWTNIGPAAAINDRNEIVGFGSFNASATFTDIRGYKLTPICEADLTGSSDPVDPMYGVVDAVVDASDLFYYLDQFAANNLSIADRTTSSDPNAPGYGVPDGVLDASDFFYYLDLFTGPCWR